MTPTFADALRRAAALTRAGHLGDATRILQSALGQASAGSAPAADGDAPSPDGPRTLDLTATVVRTAAPGAGEERTAAAGSGTAEAAAARTTAGEAGATDARRPGRSLGETIRDLAAGRRSFADLGADLGANLGAGLGAGLGQRLGAGAIAGLKDAIRPGAAAEPPLPDGARFDTAAFTSPAGGRTYRVYRPAALADGGTPAGLVLMLHGCKQDPTDFATGTRMNAVAERERLIVVYPGQERSANTSACWNWFRPGDQTRDAGEPAILAALATTVAERFGVPRDRLFVAGLSAGGAMAAILAETHPEVFAAAGVHSGLPAGAAHDVASAFAAMAGRADPARPRGRSAPHGASGAPTDGARRAPRLVVFHGSADPTVHPANGDAVAAARRPASGASETLHGRSTGGRPYRRTLHRGADGAVAVEHWVVDGQGHAWSGGAPAGSFTDPSGPDASTEMVRFFLETRTDG